MVTTINCEAPASELGLSPAEVKLEYSFKDKRIPMKLGSLNNLIDLTHFLILLALACRYTKNSTLYLGLQHAVPPTSTKFKP